MAISSIGVGSGLPLEDLLKDLRNSENTALALIQSKQITAENRFSAYGKIKSAIEALQTAGKTLANDQTYGALKTTVGGDAFTATASSSAIAGKYSIQIETLASSQTLVTQGVADRTSAHGVEGVITFTLGDGTEQTLDLTGKDTSINGLIHAINTSDPSLGLSATVINDGDAQNPYRLMITSEATGTAAAIAQITVSGNADPENALQNLLGFGAASPDSSVQEQAATNAKLYINDIAITRQGNTVEGAIEGVTLTLSKTTSEASSLAVARDDSVTEKAVTAFVTAYNSLQTTIKSLTSYNIDTQSSSALTGDSLARRAQTQVRDTLNVSSSSGAIRSLAQLGITTDPNTSLLSVNAETLKSALTSHLSDAQELFAGQNGLASRLATVADSFLRSDGLLSSATDGATRNIQDLKDQYDATSARIDAKMENYRRQFTALDSMVAQMNSISTYLTQQLSMLGNLNKES